MKLLLLLVIKVYWKLIPISKRNRCLFKESCSNYVYRKTLKEGLLQGLKALKFRFNNCRPGYFEVEINGERGIITQNNQFFETNQLRDNLI